MKNILITGAQGFVGKNLLPYLQADAAVNVMTLRMRDDDWEASIPADYNTIVHLAGKAHDLKKTSNPQEYYKVNYELTRKLYDSFLTSSAEKFIFISSVKAAADIVDDVLTENVNPDPVTDYGKSKLMAEKYIQAQPLPQGKSFFILRPCMIHGPGNKGNLNLLHNFVQKGIPYPLAAYQNRRSFLSVENLCFVIKGLIDKNGINSGVYQVADDEALSTNEVVTILASSLGKKPKLWHISPAVISFFAKIGDHLRLPLNTDRLKKLTDSYHVSNEKIKKALAVSLPLSSRKGLKETADSFNA